MPCYHPLSGYRSREVSKNGKRPIVFRKSEGFSDMPVKVPCGNCIGCLLEKSREWAIRCVHEASLYEENCFITLTYSDEYLPAEFEKRSLVKKDFSDFFKRLRDRTGRYAVKDSSGFVVDPGIRYYHAGEYGKICKNCKLSKKLCDSIGCGHFVPVLGRPHYHACIFNYRFPDLKLWKTKDGIKLYTSELLSDVWGKGYCTVGDLTFESAAYTARYITKKIKGDLAVDHYGPDRIPEYNTMSRKGGIGKGWYEKYKGDVYPDDFVIHKKHKLRPPRFYDSLYEIEDPKLFGDIKHKRLLNSIKNADNCLIRLGAREEVHKSRARKLIRSYEDEN